MSTKTAAYSDNWKSLHSTLVRYVQLKSQALHNDGSGDHDPQKISFKERLLKVKQLSMHSTP
jgi:hypothetical protein